MAAQDNLSKQQFSGVVSSAAKKHIAWSKTKGESPDKHFVAYAERLHAAGAPLR